MFCEQRKFNQNWIVMSIMTVSVVLTFAFAYAANADRATPTRGPVAGLPSGLFVTQAPQNAMGVAEARQKAQEGKPWLFVEESEASRNPLPIRWRCSLSWI